MIQQLEPHNKNGPSKNIQQKVAFDWLKKSSQIRAEKFKIKLDWCLVLYF